MVILVESPGQMSNRLFTFANLLTHAHANRYKLWNPAFWPYSRYFEGTDGPYIPGYPTRGPTFPRKLHPALYKWARIVYGLNSRMSVTHLPGVNIINIRGSHDKIRRSFALDSDEFSSLHPERKRLLLCGLRFRAGEALYNHIDIVRRFFTPKKPYADQMADWQSKANERGDVRVGIHIRRGDYAKWQRGKYFYDLDVYAGIVDQIDEMLDNKALFVISSDSPCPLDGFAGHNVIAAPGHELLDVLALASCDYIAGPPSTYSLWAAFMSDAYIAHIYDPEEPITIDSFVRPTRETLEKCEVY